MIAMEVYKGDLERRQAHRNEIKQRIKNAQLAGFQYQDLMSVVRQLDADSDAAATEHEAEAAKIQAELNQQHEDLLAGKSPAAIAKRRTQLLGELCELNRRLETRCQSNKASKEALEKKAAGLYRESLEITTLENRLVKICSDSTQRQMRRNRAKQQSLNAALGECHRVLKILRMIDTTHEKNVANGFERDPEADENIEALDDWSEAAAFIRSQLAELEGEADELRQLALTE